MTQNPALDAAIRPARHLLFTFDGLIRSAETGDGLATNAPTTPYIYEALVACYESGRSAVVISGKSKFDVPAYLDRHDLIPLVRLIAASLADAINSLEIAPADCLLISSSPAGIENAQAAGISAIGYVRESGDADCLVESGAAMLIHSMSDLALSLRAHRPSL